MSAVCRTTETPIEVSRAIEALTYDSHGARNIFIGQVRNHNLGRAVRFIQYDAHRILTEKVFAEICQEAAEKWGEDLSFVVEHRVGKLEIGDIAVIVVVSSRHRDESYKASRYVIEQIKVRAPIWKKESYIDGETEWVRGHALCAHGNAAHEPHLEASGGGHVHP